MRTFDSADEFATAVGATMRTALADESLLQPLAEGLGQAEEELRAEGPDSEDGFNLRVGRFFLREEDLPVIETIGIATTAAIALLAPGVVVAGVIISAAGSFAGLVWKAWRNGAMLTPEQIAVLGLVRFHGPIGRDPLVALAAKSEPPLAPEAVDRALIALHEAEMRDGDIVALVDFDDEGRVRARTV